MNARVTAAPCPPWCAGRHLPAWPVHSADIGTVHIGEHTAFEVALRQWRPEVAPVVNVTLTDGDADTLIDLDPHAALQLARRLTEAAQILLGTWPPLAEDNPGGAR